jgi:hypothetical protein
MRSPLAVATRSERLNRTEALLTTKANEECFSLLVTESKMYICVNNPAFQTNRLDVNNSVQ